VFIVENYFFNLTLQFKTQMITMINLNRLRLRRIELGYSQEYISQELGISQAQYSKLEAGRKSFDLQILKNLLEILKFESSQVMNF